MSAYSEFDAHFTKYFFEISREVIPFNGADPTTKTSLLMNCLKPESFSSGLASKSQLEVINLLISNLKSLSYSSLLSYISQCTFKESLNNSLLSHVQDMIKSSYEVNHNKILFLLEILVLKVDAGADLTSLWSLIQKCENHNYALTLALKIANAVIPGYIRDWNVEKQMHKKRSKKGEGEQNAEQSVGPNNSQM